MSTWLVCLVAFYTVFITEAVHAMHHAPGLTISDQ
jgi:hypothetical protein